MQPYLDPSGEPMLALGDDAWSALFECEQAARPVVFAVFLASHRGMMDGFDGVLRAEVNGVSLAYREHGRGEPVVFVHGSASDMRTWEHQLQGVGASHRAIVYSRRYARPNEPIPEGADDPMLPHVDDLVSFMKGVDAAPAHLVGHSWGGFISLLAAIRHPEAVRSLVLMEPPVLSLFVSTPPRPSELLRMLLGRPRTAIAILRFGITAAEPAAKAYRRGDDEAGFELFARGVLGREAFEGLSSERRAQAWDNVAVDKAQLLGEGFPAAERRAGAWGGGSDFASAWRAKPRAFSPACRPARRAAAERAPSGGAGRVAHHARGQSAGGERGDCGVFAGGFRGGASALARRGAWSAGASCGSSRM